jgi:signal transduction histidine kinase
MKFFWKIFIAVFITISTVGSLLIWTSYRFMSHWTTKEYVSRYATFSTVLGDALGNLDISTETFMRNAAEVVAERDAQEGILSTERLNEIRSQLNVTHIFVINDQGDFIRSTNEDPKLIPNVFTFCDQYSKLLTGEKQFDATPIIRPFPEIEPYKFLFVPTKDRKRLIEVGVRVDFVAQTLIKALGADSNLVSFSLYSPVGEVLGRFSAKGVEFSNSRTNVPVDFPTLTENKDSYQNFIKLPSSHPTCCQCRVAGITRNGEHYYVLEAEFSKDGLNPVHAAMRKAFVLFSLVTVLLAILMSHYISRRLVANIEVAVKKLKLIKSGSAKRIRLTSGDEVAFLTDQFDCLLDQLEESQMKIVESERLKAKVQLAREVAHNIKSPTLAIEMVMPMLKNASEGAQKVIRDSASDIKRLANRLLKQAHADDKKCMILNPALENIFLKPFLEDIVQKRNLEHQGNKPNYILLRSPEVFAEVIIYADETELNAVLSNLINNAMEAYPENIGVVHITCEIIDDTCVISIRDFGCGIPQQILEKIGNEEITHNKVNGEGIGLFHAYNSLRSWGGRVEIESAIGKGTTVRLIFPYILRGSFASDSNPPHLDQRIPP